jgi:hypothetical protein
MPFLHSFSSLKFYFFLFLITPVIILPAQNSLLPTLDDSETIMVGGLSANVLQPGQEEFNCNASLYSQWLAIYDAPDQGIVTDRYRLTEFVTKLEAYYGISRNASWDIGLRLNYARRRLDNAAQSSPFKVFEEANIFDENDPTRGQDQSYAGLREIGLRLRLLPFQRVPQLSLNMGYSFAPNQETTVQENLNADRNSFDINLAYYIALNDNVSSLYYFILNSTAYSKGTIASNNTPLYSSSFSFLVVQRLGSFVIYPGLSYVIGYKPPHVSEKTLVKYNEQVLGILGVQYQLNTSVNFNLSTSYPFLSESPNLLQEQVRNSYFFLNLGGRVLF